METNEMNLYIINDVLYDHTPGMAVVAASSLERCRELFHEEFAQSYGLSDYMREFDEAVMNDEITVLNVVDREEGVVSYVYGGG
jgi:hypothetical protein